MTEGRAPDSPGLIDTVKRVAGALQQAGIPFALTGGAAAYARGGSMPEHDADFLIRGEDAEAALTCLAAAGLQTARPPEDWLVKAYDQGRLVDLIFRPVQTPVNDETLADTDRLCVGGSHMPVISETVLMEHALLRMHPHECDFAPALQLARLFRERIDWGRLAKETAGSPYASAFLVLATELDIGPPRPQGA
jgi:hypothetical protein